MQSTNDKIDRNCSNTVIQANSTHASCRLPRDRFVSYLAWRSQLSFIRSCLFFLSFFRVRVYGSLLMCEVEAFSGVIALTLY